MTHNCWLEERNACDRRSSCTGIQAIGGLQDRPDGHAQGGGASEHMVAVGNSKVLGTTAHSAISQGFGPGFVPPVWRVRDGWTNTYVLWDNFYGDMLAVIGLNRGSVNDVPPERPIGSSLSAGSYELWVDATNQFQTEGTLLFDIVFSSIDLLGPHADQDLRRIQKWKHDGVKDGRALVRWALSFAWTDRPGKVRWLS